jgi:hypothetical protein
VSGIERVSFRKPREHRPRLSAPYQPGRHSERFWSEAEKDVLRDHYAERGAAWCAEQLPGRGLRRVYAMAKALGLRAGGRAAPRRSWRERAAEIDAQLREAWPGMTGRGAVAAFADAIGVPPHVVSARIEALGLAIPHVRKEPPWTAAEEALLQRAPLHDPGRAAQFFAVHGFRRTPAAITVRAKRLGLSRRFRGALSARAVARILGVDDKWVTARMLSGDLPAQKRATDRLPQQGGDPWAIAPAQLRAWVLDRLGEIDIRKVDKFAFVHLLTADHEAAAEPAAEAEPPPVPPPPPRAPRVAAAPRRPQNRSTTKTPRPAASAGEPKPPPAPANGSTTIADDRHRPMLWRRLREQKDRRRGHR